jgi:cytochrome P450
LLTVDGVQDHGEMDVIRDLAYPLPVIVIAECWASPKTAPFKGWSDDLLPSSAQSVTRPI